MHMKRSLNKTSKNKLFKMFAYYRKNNIKKIKSIKEKRTNSSRIHNRKLSCSNIQNIIKPNVSVDENVCNV